MALIKERKVLAAKLESVIGTAATLASGTDAMINAFDVSIDADIPYNERMAPGAFGRQAGNVGAYSGGVKFKMEGYGSGTAGTAPAWATVLLQSCGMSVASGLFSPISAFSAQKSATIAVFEDGIEKKLIGSMGSWSFDGEDGKIGIFSFDYKGVWVPVVDAAMFTPQFLTTVVPPRFAGATLSIGSYTPTAPKIGIKYGTVVEMREDITQASGYVSAVITDRKVTGTLDPETTNVASATGDGGAIYDAFGLWLAGTTAAFSLSYGATGTGFTIAAPELQYTGIKEGDRNGKITSNLDWIAAQNGSTVDSELTIQF
jgi:hypothetical protein